MDTSATKLLKVRKCRGVTRAPAWPLANFGGLATLILLLFLCGCNLLRPASPRTATAPSAATPAKTNNLVSARPTPGGQTKPKATPPSQPQAVRETKTPPVQPAKGAERLLATSLTAPQPLTPDSRSRPAADKGPLTVPSTVVSVVPGPAGTQLIIKGPPRPPRLPSSRATPLTWVALGAAIVLGVLRLYSKRRRSVPASAKGAQNDLVMPGDFKMKESAIQPAAPTGILGIQAPRRLSLAERLTSAGLIALSFLRFVQRKISMKRPMD